MSNYYNGLVQTTTATEIDCSKFESISSVSVDADVPENTSLHFVFQLNGGNWKKYSTTDKAWQDITGDVTADNIAEVGNTLAEVQALTSTELASFVGTTVNLAIALTMDESQTDVPVVRGVKFVGKTPANVTSETVDGPSYTLSDTNAAVRIISIKVNKTETGNGKVQVLASAKLAGGNWSDYADVDTYVNTKALAIKFRAVLSVSKISTDKAEFNGVEILHRTDDVAVLTEGTGVVLTKTYNFINPISRAHLMVKHPIVADTEVTAQIALRESPTTVKGEVLGTGTGASQTVTLANTTNLASHDFALYFDGVQQASGAYSFSPTDGQVTFTADEGVSVTADYVYNWSKETFVDFTHDTVYPDKNDNTLVDDQFDYIAGDNDPKGSVGTVRVSLIQKTGKEKDVALGTGNGKAQSFKLAHHAKYETIDVKPAAATWKFKDNTDVLTVTAKEGEAISVSYNWAARPNYLESIACIFNE
ncbi:MAG: hypothetical protein SPL39_02970 [Selenomonadaceae bacterium]|nr:hypothetical protein [Selenomonadaceae bacterium]